MAEELIDPEKYDYFETGEDNILRQVKGGSQFEAEWFTRDGWTEYPFFESLRLDSSSTSPETAQEMLEWEINRWRELDEKQQKPSES